MRIENIEKKIILTTTFLIFFLQFSSAARRKRQIVFEDDDRENAVFSADCRTPDSRPGRCIRLTSCSVLRQGLSRYRLQRYICGFEGDEPKVCCPQPRVEVTTRRPTIIRTTPSRATPSRATPTRATPPRATPPRTTVRPTRRTTSRTTIRFEEEPRNGGRPGTSSGQTPRPSGFTRPSFLPRSCGVSRHHTMTRVVGGSRAEKGSWPWMAIVFVRRNNGALIPDCGGALVTNRHVVTAAHCVVTGRRSTPLDASRIVVRLGAHNLTIQNEPGAVDAEVEEVRKHEQFESRTYKNDIAVLKLRRPVSFSATISPVCLPYDSLRGEDLTSKSVMVIGYGTTAFNGNSSDVLMQASFYIQSQEVCRAAYEPEVQMSDVYMCAGMMDGSKDACQGDSGGPLITLGKNSSYYLIGVVSFGKQCGQPNYPGVYANVTAFLDWLAVNLAD